MTPPATLRELLHYDPETGALTWLPRGRSWFSSEGDWKSWNIKNAGKTAFSRVGADGYFCGCLLGRSFRSHRVAFAIFHGRWPVGPIDHLNGNPKDNRAANLREATPSLNCMNQRLRVDNYSGVPGVTRRGDTWIAAIKAFGKATHLGSFRTKEAAIEARLAAQAKLPFGPNHGAPR